MICDLSDYDRSTLYSLKKNTPDLKDEAEGEDEAGGEDETLCSEDEVRIIIAGCEILA